jgi:hypothetical protein
VGGKRVLRAEVQPPAAIPLIEVQRAGAQTLNLYCEGPPELLFCENEANVHRLCGVDSPGQFYKDGINDVNPPWHAWAASRVFQIDREQRSGEGDLPFLERVFHKLLLNFTWWVNRKDPGGSISSRAASSAWTTSVCSIAAHPCPPGGYINQADATGWMAKYCLDLMRIALEPAQHNPVYQDVATKFFEHFLSPYGMRALSRVYRDHPYVLDHKGTRLTVQYQPAESDSGMFGGNSNWRGPVWMPVNDLIIESLLKFHHILRRRLSDRVPHSLRPAHEHPAGG